MRYGVLLALAGFAAFFACGENQDANERHADLLAPNVVELDSAQLEAAGVSLGTVVRLPPDTIPLTGTITFDAARVSHVGPRTQGRIRKVYVDIGAGVAAGDTLAVLDSPELGAAQARWFQARVAQDVAARNFGRAERLFRDGIVSERRRLEAEAQLREQAAELAATLQALSALGAEPDTTASGVFVLRAPFAGEVVEKHATVGEVVGPENSLFVVGDLNRVWILLDLYETDLPRIRPGAAVRVVADAYPDRPFDACITQIGAVVDTVSRTIKVRVEIPNPGHVLKPGMFVRADIAASEPERGIGIPRTAVQTLGDGDVVFVPDGPRRFRVHAVKLGHERAGGWIEVVGGLALGDTVVVAGSFALKAQLLRATLGEEGH